MVKTSFEENGNLKLDGDLEKNLQKEDIEDQFIKFSNGVIVRICYDSDIKILEQHSKHIDIDIEYYQKQTNNGDVLIIHDNVDGYEIESNLEELK